MYRVIPARIRFLLPSEGGRSTSAMSGIRPQLKLEHVFTSCVVRSKEPMQVFELGQDYDVTLEIVFWDEYRHLFRNDLRIELFEGSKLIARGQFDQVSRDG